MTGRRSKLTRGGQAGAADRRGSVLVRVTAPYALARSTAVAASFTPTSQPDGHPLRFAVRLGRRVVRVEVSQTTATTLRATFAAGADPHALRRLVSWVVLADLDLRPFYRLVAGHRVLGPLVRRYRGLKPLRPPQLFEMAVVAIIEQQISLAAAHAIRARLVERFGERAEDCWAFPEPRTLAAATGRQLRLRALAREGTLRSRALAQARGGGARSRCDRGPAGRRREGSADAPPRVRSVVGGLHARSRHGAS